jgi:lipid II:glycine glycyltransferase (peptidoglycan interpeptide bridge formation enzyme)
MDLRQSPSWIKYMQSIGWQVETTSLGVAFIRRLPLIGSLVKIPRSNLPVSVASLDEIAKKHRALFIKIEPNATNDGLDEDFLKLLKHFSVDKWSFAPTKTIVVDLSPSEEEILKRMEKDTRYCIRLAEKKGVKVIESQDLKTFLKLYQETARRKGFWLGPIGELKQRWQAFSEKEEGKLYFASHPSFESPLAAAMVLFSGRTAYYYHAASSGKNRELMAPYLLLWEIIKSAKKRGCIQLDLEGIYDRRIPSTKGWQGFTHFKRGFGGFEVEYVGSFTRYYNPILKLLFKLGNLIER